MEFLKKTFWALFIITILILSWKIVPIYYKSIAIRSICKDNADRIYRYSPAYIKGSIDDQLNELNIPKSKRQHNVTKSEEGTYYVEIYFEETADFFGYYQKKFEFYHECKSEAAGVF